MMKKLLTCSLGVMLGVGMLASCTTPTVPTTANPTTQTPSTVAPSTQDPSSEAPSTQAPSSQDPSSEAPSTQDPSTQAPSTQDPSSEAPSTQAPSSETQTSQPDPIPTKTYYAEIEPSWTEVYAYAWEGDNNNSWPGAKMSNVSENIYSIELNASYTTVIFNNNSGSQTVNIGILDDYNAFIVTNNKSGQHYTADYATYENGVMTPAQTKPAIDFYVIGSHSNWGENDSYKLTRNQDGTEATITVPLATGTQFKITNGSWNPEFNAGNVTLPSNLTKGDSSNIKVVEGATFTFTVKNPDEDNRSLTITSVPAPKALPKTVAEIAAYTAESNTVVEVSGVVQNIANTTYGNFYLVDPTTKHQILVYGLSAKKDSVLSMADNGDGTYTGSYGNNDKSFSSLKVAEGDFITMHAVVGWFGSKPQLKGVLVEETTWTSGDYTVTLPEGSAEGTVTADKASYKYGETVTLTVTPAEGYKVASVKVNHGYTGTSYATAYGNATEASGSYTFSAHIINNVQVVFAAEQQGEIQTSAETLKITAKGGTPGTKSISWTGTNFTLLNEKASSSNDIRTSDADHFRAYQGSKTTISGVDGAKIVKIIVTSTESKYATALVGSVNASTVATAEAKGTVVTITVTGDPAESISFAATAQWRLKSIEVHYTK